MLFEFDVIAAINRPSGDQRGEKRPMDPGTSAVRLLSRSKTRNFQLVSGGVAFSRDEM